MKIGIVLGKGGHTRQGLILANYMKQYVKLAFILSKTNSLAEKKIHSKGLTGDIIYVESPRDDPNASKLKSAWRTIKTFFIMLRILNKYEIDAVASAGSGLTIPVFLAAKILGKHTFYIESLSRVKELSMTGKILYGRTDLFFVQWKELANRYPKALYRGKLI